MIVAGTGHRPDKLGGWDSQSAFYKTVNVAVEALEEQKPIGVVSGMAAGWDLALAHAAISLEIPLLCAVPFEGQDRRWSKFWRDKYKEALYLSTEIRTLYTPDMDNKWEISKALTDRNHWMVEYIYHKGGKILALWNGTKGGTSHCVRSAERRGLEIVNYWERFSSLSQG
jgi:uncharacterized phage-like protein YoqJ